MGRRTIPILLAALLAMPAGVPVHAKDAASTRKATAQSGRAVHVPGRARYGHGVARFHRHGFHRHVHHHRLHAGWLGWWSWWGWWPAPYAWGPGGVWVEVVDGERSPASIETDIRPKRAQVILDGEDVGEARDYNGRWDVLWLPPGRHVVEFRLDGYQTLRLRLKLRAGEALRLVYRLRPGKGLDPRSTPPDEAEVRPAPSPRPRAGAHGRSEEPAAPHARAGEGIERGFLRLDVLPDGAAVYLDGAFLGTAGELRGLHGGIPVAAGEHVIEVVHPDEQPVEKIVEVEPGRTAVVRVRLGQSEDRL